MAQAAAQKSKAKIGRPTVLTDSVAQIAITAAQFGATDAEIASACGVSVPTLYRWYAQVPAFRKSVKEDAKEVANARVGRTMYSKAIGYDYEEEQAIKVKVGKDQEAVEIVTVKRHQPADTTAGIFFLKNRDPENWRDVQKVEADVNHNIQVDDRKLALAMLNVLNDANRKVIEGEYANEPAAIESSVPSGAGVREDSQPDPAERGEGEELAPPARGRRRA